jgi:hypothetical protein
MKFTNSIANDAGGFDFYTRKTDSTYINALQILGTGNATFAGNISAAIGAFNSGTTNVVSTFTSTDGTATLQCVDSVGNVEFGASGNNFVVQPAGGLAQLTVGATTSTFAGNVGIGTTSPFGRLNVSRAGINEGAISFDDQANNAHLVLAGTDALVRMQLGTYNNGSYGAWIQASYDNGGVNYGTEPLILNPQGGNVGIGTTSPVRRLDVNGGEGVRVSGYGLRNSVQSANSGFIQVGGSNNLYGLLDFNAYDGNTIFEVSNTYASAAAELRLGGGFITMRVGATPSEAVRITSGGTVGIGATSGITTSTYAGKLAISAASGANVVLSTGTNTDNAIVSRIISVNSNNANSGNEGAAEFYGVTSIESAITTTDSNAGGDSGGYIMLKTKPEAGALAERMRITAAGNVGIGTTTANTLLSIDGVADNGISIQGIGTTATRAFFGLDASGDGYMSLTNGGTFVKNVQLTSDLGVDNYILGNVGIGTTDPVGKLSVEATGNHITLRAPGATAGKYWALDVTTANQFYLINNAGTQYLTITDAGNVGIGTSAPVSHSPTRRTLVVSDTVNGANVEIWGNNAGGKSILQSVGGDTYVGNLANGSGAGTTYITSGNGSTYTTFLANGNVGIGTTNPSSKLHISGSSAQLLVQGNNYSGIHQAHAWVTNTYFGARYDGTNEVYGATGRGAFKIVALHDANNDPQYLAFYGADAGTAGNAITWNTVGFAQDEDGNVGIGTTAPNQMLHLARANADNYIKVEAGGTAANYSGLMLTEYGINWGWALRHNAFTDLLHISYQDNTPTFSDTVTFNRNGNVGIGTSPEDRLHIAGGHLLLNNGIELRSKDTGGSVRTIARVNSSTNDLEYGWSGAGAVKFMGGGAYTERMRIHTDGNVGIGTTSPASLLTIFGAGNTLRLDSSSGADKEILMRSVGTGTGTLKADGNLRLWSEDSGRSIIFKTFGGESVIDSSGNVGIGTTTPATKLHVVGTAETRLRVGSSNASSNVVLELRDENSPTGQGTVITYNNATGETYFNNAMSTATTDFHFQSGEYGSASDFFTLSNSGGNSIVHLSTTTGDSFITYEDSTNELAIASDGDLRLTTPTDQDVFFISSGGNIDMTQAGGNVDMGGNLIVDGDITGNSNAYIDGNVGIGTNNPSYKLTVSSGTDDIGILTASSDSGSYVGFLDNATSTIPKVGAVGNKLILDASQYVGVRRTDPSYALDVSGTIRATGDVIAYSDARVKENVETIPNALDKVKAMRGVGYNKIGEEKRSIGVIAQEMLEVMPEVVSQDEQGMYSVAYGNLVGVLIEAVKDLESKVEQLQNKIDGAAK